MYGPKKSFAQSTYFDQQATALPGMLANASDINLVDSAYVNTTADGSVAAGVAVVVKEAVGARTGVNYDTIRPIEATDTAISGVLVRNQFMRTSAGGEACFYNQDMGNYLRADRVGGRIWVKLTGSAATTVGGKVFVVKTNTASNNNVVGAFTAAAVPGEAKPTAGYITGGAITAGSLTSVTDGKFKITVDANEAKEISCDFTGKTDLAGICAVVNAALGTATAGATATVQGSGIRITSATTGASSKVSEATAGSDGTDISGLLGLTKATGAVVTAGSDGVTNDTIEVAGAKFCSVSTPVADDPANSIALVEFGLR